MPKPSLRDPLVWGAVFQEAFGSGCQVLVLIWHKLLEGPSPHQAGSSSPSRKPAQALNKEPLGSGRGSPGAESVGSSGVATLMVIMATMMRRASMMFLLVVVVAGSAHFRPQPPLW